MFLSAGQTSDYIGARALLSQVPQTEVLLADRGYDADWFRNTLIELGISPCIPSKLSRQSKSHTMLHSIACATRSRTCSPGLKDSRRVATRYDRCPILFLSACALAAIMRFTGYQVWSITHWALGKALRKARHPSIIQLLRSPKADHFPLKIHGITDPFQNRKTILSRFGQKHFNLLLAKNVRMHFGKKPHNALLVQNFSADQIPLEAFNVTDHDCSTKVCSCMTTELNCWH